MHFSIKIIPALIYLSLSICVFAEVTDTIPEVINEEVNALIGMPLITTQTGADGTVTTTFSSPVTGISAGTITRPTGEVTHFTASTNAVGQRTYTVASPGTPPVTATQESDGTFTGDPVAIASVAAVVANLSTPTPAGPITVITSESIPGADCSCIAPGGDCSRVETRKYACIVESGLTGFQAIFAQVIRFIINITLLLGVLAVVALGITWSFAGGDDIQMKNSMKKWAFNIIVGLIILFLFKYILMFIAPWIYQ